MKNTLLLALALAYATLPVCAQNIGGHEDISDEDVVPWVADSAQEYQHVYHFGDSEWEYHLVIIVTDSGSYAFTRRGEFNEAATDWILTYEPLNNVRINEDRFYCDAFQGQFALYKGEQKGLKMLNKTNDLHKDYEFGPQSHPVADFFVGSYPQASYTVLDETALEQLTKEQLQLMRNEIFARYGYRFIPDGKMDKHFQGQKWYKAQHTNVTAFLTALEEENIAKIKRAEGKK